MYSQKGEDNIIWDFLSNKGIKGSFLDIGANDGNTLSNTYRFAQDGQNGVLVDASPMVFKRLKDIHGENKLEYELVSPNSRLMQFTGLLDKNKKEIYESDILLNPVMGDHWIVEWEEGQWIAKHPEDVKEPLVNIQFTIIGNIYEGVN